MSVNERAGASFGDLSYLDTRDWGQGRRALTLGWHSSLLTCVAAECMAAGSAPARTARSHVLGHLPVHLPVGNLVDGPATQKRG